MRKGIRKATALEAVANAEKDPELCKVRGLMSLEWRVCMVLESERWEEWAGQSEGNRGLMGHALACLCKQCEFYDIVAGNPTEVFKQGRLLSFVGS